MQLIRCTKRLQKEMGLKKSELFEHEPEASLLGSWHANLIYIDRRKCVLFVNDKTLFNFIAPFISRAQIRELTRIFKDHLEHAIYIVGVPGAAKAKIISEYESIQYANTNNKSVLGSMNDLAFHYKYYIQSEGGVYSYTVPSIIERLNHMPMGALEYMYPIDVLKSIYDN